MTLYAAVEKLYRDGTQITPMREDLLVGRINSYREGHRECVKLWPVDFPAHMEASPHAEAPLAVLWLPEFVGIAQSAYLLLRGQEAVGRPPHRRWVFQKWRCEITDLQGALRRQGERQAPG